MIDYSYKKKKQTIDDGDNDDGRATAKSLIPWTLID